MDSESSDRASNPHEAFPSRNQFGRWRAIPAQLMLGIVSIARYLLESCKQP
jgi:hypothetical protein